MSTTSITINAQKRTEFGKGNSRNFRNQGFIPAVIYGPTVKAESIIVDNSDILRVYRKAKTTKVIDLHIEKDHHEVLIKKVDLDPVKNTIQHVDLYVIEKGKKLTVKVPIKYNGTPFAVKNLGGTLNISHNEIEIQCFPRDIPTSFELDITNLKDLHSHLSVADLNLKEEKYALMGLTPDVILCGISGRKNQEDENEAPEEQENTEAPEEKKEE